MQRGTGTCGDLQDLAAAVVGTGCQQGAVGPPGGRGGAAEAGGGPVVALAGVEAAVQQQLDIAHFEPGLGRDRVRYVHTAGGQLQDPVGLVQIGQRGLAFVAQPQGTAEQQAVVAEVGVLRPDPAQRLAQDVHRLVGQAFARSVGRLQPGAQQQRRAAFGEQRAVLGRIGGGQTQRGGQRGNGGVEGGQRTGTGVHGALHGGRTAQTGRFQRPVVEFTGHRTGAFEGGQHGRQPRAAVQLPGRREVEQRLADQPVGGAAAAAQQDGGGVEVVGGADGERLDGARSFPVVSGGPAGLVEQDAAPGGIDLAGHLLTAGPLVEEGGEGAFRLVQGVVGRHVAVLRRVGGGQGGQSAQDLGAEHDALQDAGVEQAHQPAGGVQMAGGVGERGALLGGGAGAPAFLGAGVADPAEHDQRPGALGLPAGGGLLVVGGATGRGPFRRASRALRLLQGVRLAPLRPGVQQGAREVRTGHGQPFGGRAQQPDGLDQVPDGAVLFVALQEGGAFRGGAVGHIRLPGGRAQGRFEAAQHTFRDPGEGFGDGPLAGLGLTAAAGEHGDRDGREVAGAAAEGALDVERAVLEDQGGLARTEPAEEFVAHAGHEVVPGAAHPGLLARRPFVRRKLRDQAAEQHLGQLRRAGLRQHRALDELDDGEGERDGREMDGEQAGGG